MKAVKLPRALKRVADAIGAYGIFFSTAIAIGSFLVSGFTLYWTTLRPSEIVVMHGPLAQFAHWQNDTIGINLPLVIQNVGGRAATIRLIALRISGDGLARKLLLSPRGLVSINSSTNNTMYTGFLAPEVIGGSALSSHTVAFSSTDPVTWPLSPGKYEIEVLIWKDAKQASIVADTFSLLLSQNAAERLSQAGSSVSITPSDVQSLFEKS